MNILKTTTTEVRHAVRLGRLEILELMRKSGIEIPENASIVFEVPGGGDWSNMDCELEDSGHRSKVFVQWATVESDEPGPSLGVRQLREKLESLEHQWSVTRLANYYGVMNGTIREMLKSLPEWQVGRRGMVVKSRTP